MTRALSSYDSLILTSYVSPLRVPSRAEPRAGARLRVVQPGEQRAQRALPGPALPDQPDHLPPSTRARRRLRRARRGSRFALRSRIALHSL
jgi:hypothetical protein